MSFKFQGTDGVRRRACPSDNLEVRGLSPQQALIERDYLTEEFVELYLYCRVRQLIENGLATEGEHMAIGWDPRDPSAVFTDAAIRGVRKGGLHVDKLGVIATPGVPLYVIVNECAAGSVITASHNPSTYNGVKIFTRRGLKLLPGDDFDLSERILNTDYAEVIKATVKGEVFDRAKEARSLFVDFHREPKNSWVTAHDTLANIVLVLDTANGALSETAAEVCRAAGFGVVIAVNTKLDGTVNVRSGVGDLESHHEIGASMIEDGGIFRGYEAIETIFSVGRRMQEEIMEGSKSVSLAVFDGDGDRFIRGEYNPYNDSVSIISGDEISIHLATYQKAEGRLFVNTVESDLVVAAQAQERGYAWEFTTVGDKWLLLRAYMSYLQTVTDENSFSTIKTLAENAEPRADEIERALDKITIGKSEAIIPFAVGAEESGHIITPGITEKGDPIFCGNGLKSCLNSFIATSEGEVAEHTDTRDRFYHIVHPYPRGFKKTLYVYNIDKSLFHNDSPVWNEVRDAVIWGTYRFWSNVSLNTMILPQEPNMLYLRINQMKKHVASLFIRNSGTEDKIGVNLRGPVVNRDRLLGIGEEAIRVLLVRMKDQKKDRTAIERILLTYARDGGAPSDPVCDLDADDYKQLLIESSIKQGLIDKPYPGAQLTERGLWMINAIERGWKR
jgi:phosphomannomutase